jgi:nucleoside-diphosphate-sugar epimerase
MKVLVTGATGFVGGHLAEALCRRKDQVTALARSPVKARTLAGLGIRVIEGHLDDRAAIAAAVEGQELIYHVAGVVASGDEAGFQRANVGGTRNLLAAAALEARRPRVVLVSSMAAAGPASPGHPLVGTEPPRPVTAYGRSKLAAEALVTGSGLPWTILRPPTVYGPRDREVLKLFRLARLGLVPVFGDGRQELSAVYVLDLADALIAAAISRTALGRIYYPCHPQVFSGAEFVRTIGKAMGKRLRVLPVPSTVGRGLLAVTQLAARLSRQPTILTVDKGNEFFQPAWTGDPQPMTRDTGWRAVYDLERGLKETWRWYRSAGWL